MAVQVCQPKSSCVRSPSDVGLSLTDADVEVVHRV